jgi:hypothetical protein
MEERFSMKIDIPAADDFTTGWGLEPDLRSPESQPAAAHHAFEVFAEVAPVRTAQAALLCDWLDSVTRDNGGLPFALPLTTTAGSGPWWTGADAGESSLQTSCRATVGSRCGAVLKTRCSIRLTLPLIRGTSRAPSSAMG